MLPFLILTPLIAGGLAGIDPELLKSRTDNGLAIAAAAGLAIATVVFALRIGMGIVGLGFAQLAQREQQAMWEAIEEMEQAIDAESTPEDRALGN